MNKELMTGHLYRVKAQDYPTNGTTKTMYYATACDRDTEGIDQLLDRLQLAGTRRTEVKWAWNLLLDAVQMSLEAGHPVCLDGLARISLTCTSPPLHPSRRCHSRPRAHQARRHASRPPLL